MDLNLICQTLLSFVVSGVWIACATWVAERVGSRIGGLVGNLPSKLLVTLVFLALVHDEAFAIGAARAVPTGMLINAIFLFTFVLIVPLGLRVSVPASLLLWFGLAVTAEHFQIASFGLSILFYLIVTLLAYSFLEFVVHIPVVEGKRRPTSPRSMLFRGVFAGGVVGATVFLSPFVGTYWSGLLATFPAVMLTSMTILTLAGGPGLARATGKVMLFASTNIIVFTLAIIWSYPVMGLAVGTLVSFAVSAVWVALLHPLVKRLEPAAS
ncbi:DUF3147 family protein [Gemmatimonadota bacterium]